MNGGERVVEGYGLHGGARCRVTLRRVAGPVRLRVHDPARDEASPWVAVDALAPMVADRTTRVALGADGAQLGLVEHLFAALAGLGIHGGVAVDVVGTELPLLDGGALTWTEALRALAVPASSPSLRVVRDDVVEVGASRYAFTRSEGTRVAVRIVYDDARLEPEARWSGDAADFEARIAPSRTFCLEAEVAELARRGLASHVTPDAVVVIGGAIHVEGRPFAADEAARHKLLDFMGDLYLHGGPPVGFVHAVRPGHAATHEAMRIARARGILVRV